MESSTNLFVFNDWDSFYAYSYFFTISDHLGNTRLVVDEQGELQQKNKYGEEKIENGKREEKRKFCSNQHSIPRLRRADVPTRIR